MSVDVTKTVSQDLKRTPLHALHLALGARMAPFAGYDRDLPRLSVNVRNQSNNGHHEASRRCPPLTHSGIHRHC